MWLTYKWQDLGRMERLATLLAYIQELVDAELITDSEGATLFETGARIMRRKWKDVEENSAC